MPPGRSAAGRCAALGPPGPGVLTPLPQPSDDACSPGGRPVPALREDEEDVARLHRGSHPRDPADAVLAGSGRGRDEEGLQPGEDRVDGRVPAQRLGEDDPRQPSRGAGEEPGHGEGVCRAGMPGEREQRLRVGAEVHPVGQAHLEPDPPPGVVHQRVQGRGEEALVVLPPRRGRVVGAARPQCPAADEHPDVDPHEHDGEARRPEEACPSVDDDEERPEHDDRHGQRRDDDPDERPDDVQDATHGERWWGDAAGAHIAQARAAR